MKKYILLSMVVIGAFAILESFTPNKIARRDGSDPGYTGSPGDNNMNCTSCHGGGVYQKSGWIRSNIPSTGYVPGNKYTITATNTFVTGTIFGFQVSPQKLNGELLGTIVITDTVRTKLVGNDKYVTYRANGVQGVDSCVWTFDWIAPPTGSGEVVFYGAFNANPGHKGSDGTTLSTLSVLEEGTTGKKVMPDPLRQFILFPNLASGNVQIKFHLTEPSEIMLDICDMNGKMISRLGNGRMSGSVQKQYNTNALPNGNYLVRIHVNGKILTQKLTVFH